MRPLILSQAYPGMREALVLTWHLQAGETIVPGELLVSLYAKESKEECIASPEEA